MPEGVARQRWRWVRKASVLLARLVALRGFEEEEEEVSGLEAAGGVGPGTGSPVGRSMGLSTTWDADSVMLGDLILNQDRIFCFSFLVWEQCCYPWSKVWSRWLRGRGTRGCHRPKSWCCGRAEVLQYSTKSLGSRSKTRRRLKTTGARLKVS